MEIVTVSNDKSRRTGTSRDCSISLLSREWCATQTHNVADYSAGLLSVPAWFALPKDEIACCDLISCPIEAISGITLTSLQAGLAIYTQVWSLHRDIQCWIMAQINWNASILHDRRIDLIETYIAVSSAVIATCITADMYIQNNAKLADYECMTNSRITRKVCIFGWYEGK